jgi:hypothetical protein
LYTEGQWSYVQEKTRLSLSLPLSYTLVSYNDPVHGKASRNNFFITPRLNFLYAVSRYWTTGLTTGYTVQNGNIRNVYRGYLLQTYRNLSNNNSPLLLTKTLSGTYNFTFRNPLNMLFFNAGVTLSYARRNLLYQRAYNNLLETLTAVERNNAYTTVTVFSRVSKYLPLLKTTCAVGLSYTQNRQQQLQQQQLVQLLNRSVTLNGSISANFSKAVAAEYNLLLNRSVSRSSALQQQNTFQTLTQKFTIDLVPLSNTFLRFSGEHYLLHQRAAGSNACFFGDVSLRRKFVRQKIDAELGIQNLFNKQHYTTAEFSDNIEIVSEYLLRPRQLLAKVYFTF